MSIAFMIYLINVATSLKAVASAISLIGVIALTTGLILTPLLSIDFPDAQNKLKLFLYKVRYVFIIIYPLSILCIIVIPDKTDMYIILGLSVAETVITSDKGNELFDKSYQLVIDKIDEAIEEKSEKSKEK